MRMAFIILVSRFKLCWIMTYIFVVITYNDGSALQYSNTVIYPKRPWSLVFSSSVMQTYGNKGLIYGSHICLHGSGVL